MSFFKFGEKVDGQFQELEHGHYFEYRRTDNWWAIQQGLDFEVAVGGPGHGLRFANILKTVAYMALGEDEDGNAVIEKWNVKSCWGKDFSKTVKHLRKNISKNLDF